MLGRFSYRQNNLPWEINLLIENFAVKETGKNRGRIQQLILENDLPELRKNLEERVKIHQEIKQAEIERNLVDASNSHIYDRLMFSYYTYKTSTVRETPKEISPMDIKQSLSHSGFLTSLLWLARVFRNR